MCIGRPFVEAQVRLVMQYLARRYRWRLPDDYRIPVQRVPISKLSDGLPLALEALR